MKDSEIQEITALIDNRTKGITEGITKLEQGIIDLKKSTDGNLFILLGAIVIVGLLTGIE